MMKHIHANASESHKHHARNWQPGYGILMGLLLLVCCVPQIVIAQDDSVTSATAIAGEGLVPEACCLGDTCEMLEPYACIAAGGTPMGPGTQCAPREACCFRSGACQDMDPTCCIFQATGTPGGPGTACLGDNDQDGKDDACAPSSFSCDSVSVYNSYISSLPCTQGIYLQYNTNPSLIYAIQLVPQSPVTMVSATAGSPFVVSSLVSTSVTWAETGGNPIPTGPSAANLPIGTFSVNTGGAFPQNYTVYFLGQNNAVLCSTSAFATDCPVEPDCPNNLLQNWSFEQGSTTGPMPSPGQTNSWMSAYGSPDVAASNGGCGDVFYVAMWGNQLVGEALQQPGVTLTQNITYQVSLCARWAQEPNRPYPPRFRVRASTGPLSSPTDPNGVTIGVTPYITTPNVWTTFTLPLWMAPSTYFFLTVSPENQSSFNHGDSTTYAYVDRICIKEVPHGCATPPACMVAWYPLDETTGSMTVTDIAPPPSSSVNNVGTCMPGPVGPSSGPVPVVGKVGNRALYFFQPKYVDVPSQSDLNFGGGSFSIDAWIRAVGCGPGRLSPIVDKRDTSMNTGYTFYLDQPTPGSAVLKLRIDASTFTSSGTLTANASPVSNTGPWHHVAVTVDMAMGLGTFYINGSPAGTFTALAGPSSNNVSMWIGEIRAPGTARCEIAIDELELFSCALTAAEVSSIWAADSLGKCKPAGARGDVTGDGNINVLDVVTVVNHILDVIPLTGEALDRADCNGDGEVNVLDALGIVNVILGLGECVPGMTMSKPSGEAMEFLYTLEPYFSQEGFARFMALVKETQIPMTFSLYQNYPNPFNPTTSIQFAVGSGQSADHVTLKIFNVMGQEVATLVDEVKEPGYYSVTWDASDMASGVYFYRLTAGGTSRTHREDFQDTRRMVLMK